MYIQCIYGLGSFNIPSFSGSVLSELKGILVSNNQMIRHAAMRSILWQLSLIDEATRCSFIWIIMPLYADPNYEIRKTFCAFIHGVDFFLYSAAKLISTHPDDSATITVMYFWIDVANYLIYSMIAGIMKRMPS
jgi:hypothetical protein